MCPPIQVKNRVRPQLRFFQRRIEERLQRENENRADDGRTVLRGTGTIYEIASRVREVAAGGVALIH